VIPATSLRVKELIAKLKGNNLVMKWFELNEYNVSKSLQRITLFQFEEMNALVIYLNFPGVGGVMGTANHTAVLSR
jgi:hypothetical protein